MQKKQALSCHYWLSEEWHVHETNQTLSVRRNSEGELSVQWNKHSLWWKHQFWQQRHVWLTCASLANNWIVNEMYPSQEGCALDKSGFVITAGAVGGSKEKERVCTLFSLISFHKEHLPVTNFYPQDSTHSPFSLYFCHSQKKCDPADEIRSP